jgi:antitoxin SocA-like protein
LPGLRPAYDFWHNKQARSAAAVGVAMTTIRPNGKKFRELILYIARRCEGDAIFDKPKLNKILFYSDFLAYFRTGQPITGQRYTRLESGPGARSLAKTLEELVRKGDIGIRYESKVRPTERTDPDAEGAFPQALQRRASGDRRLCHSTPSASFSIGSGPDLSVRHRLAASASWGDHPLRDSASLGPAPDHGGAGVWPPAC